MVIYRFKLRDFALGMGQIGLLMLLGCGDPNLTKMQPSRGIPHTLVELEGDMLFARVLWNSNAASPDTLRSHWLGATCFSVPHNAALGDHHVRLWRDSLLSPETDTFTVTDPGTHPFPSPKITYLQSIFSGSIGVDSVRFFLFAQGPNVDVSANLSVDGVQIPTALWKAARNSFGGIDSNTYGYPAFHYSMVFAEIHARIGDALNVLVVNDGGAASNVLTYNVVDSVNWDSDNDGLLDTWESSGYDYNLDGTVDCNLPAMGSNPYIVDIFVETDFMNGDGSGSPIHKPTGNPWQIVENAFRNAPVLNLQGGLQGVQLHIDRGDSLFIGLEGDTTVIPVAERKGGTVLPFFTFIREDTANSPCGAGTSVSFYELKFNDTVLAPATVNFDSAARQPIFHYNIFAHRHGHSCGSSGRGEIGGNDFWLSGFETAAQLANDAKLSGTFMHEFGHNLGLLHGGNVNDATKPNYNSIMDYLYQLVGIDSDCDGVANGVVDYSHGLIASLDENNVDENQGLCNNMAIDWNLDAAFDSGIVYDISAEGDLTVIHDHDDWGKLKILFRNGANFND